MLTRREFVQIATASVAGLASTRMFASGLARLLGVQLYTVRDQAERDLAGVLAAIHKIGYREVEPYWNIYDHPAPQLRRMIADHGLTAPSGHFNYEGLESKLDYAQALGVRFVVCPMLPKEMWNELDGFKRAANQFNEWGEQVRARGMQFGFHNHNYEFRRFGNTTGFETLMERTDANLVCLEMDCYWVKQAGEDPVGLLERYGKRVKLLHLKDRKDGFAFSQDLNASAEHFTEVGSGTLAWPKILKTAQQTGVQHLFVERDSGDLDAIESLRVSFANLEKLA